MKINFSEIDSNIKNKAYKLVGNGSGRVVYDMEDGYVVKVAKNKKGFAQNSAEYKISTNDQTSMFAKTVDSSSDFKYIIAEKAESIRGMKLIRDYFKVKTNNELYRTEFMRNALLKYNFEVADFGRPSNWGIIDGIPVIVDYGLTGDIYNKYYLTERIGMFLIIMMFMK